MKAFPRNDVTPDLVFDGKNWVRNTSGGMDLRDYFAAKMMPRFTFRASGHAGSDEEWAFRDAIECYKAADAMMKARGL